MPSASPSFWIRQTACLQDSLLCYPVWMDDDEEGMYVGRNNNRGSVDAEASTVMLGKLGRSGPMNIEWTQGEDTAMDNSLLRKDSLTMTTCGNHLHSASYWKGGSEILKSLSGGGIDWSPSNNTGSSGGGGGRGGHPYARETRDAAATCNDRALLNALRDVGETLDATLMGGDGDLDDVIAKMIRTRDDLIQQKLKADETIQQLGLENENLKNLVSIGKKLTRVQREELTSAKLQHLRDKKRIDELEYTLKRLQDRTRDVQRALDGEDTLFGGLTTSCQDGNSRSTPSTNQLVSNAESLVHISQLGNRDPPAAPSVAATSAASLASTPQTPAPPQESSFFGW